MFRKTFATLSLTALFAVAAGCSDGDDPTGTSNLSKQQSMQIFTELMVAVNEAMFSGFKPTNGVASFNMPPETFTHTGACPQGGTATVVVTFDDRTDQNGNGSMSWQMVQTPNACKVSTQSGVFTVSGAPNITWASNWTFSNGQLPQTFTMTANGGYSFAGSQSGTCQINISFTVNTQTGAGTMTGTMCGHNVNGEPIG